ncbi:bifunctional diaminohydroxyphosphoribosylaminopyrimidine deaminase/5-amino-6-(5-phosphoribosylamino)uracil reductase RibD, partial [Senegalimassilia anaerobia]
MAGIPEQRCETNVDAEAQGAAPAALGADDARFMRRAIELAWRGWGWTNPNPLAGCVLVRDGRIIGEGWHEKCGQAHAERNALADCARRAADDAADAERADDAPAGDPARGHARGATAYVTLEPCCHTGKQPPCTEALIAAGVARVVVGSRDPNPLVAGKGSARLREAGIRVDEDVLRGECDELNPIFFRFISRKTPYVVAKWAMSADGKIACASGDA